MLTRNSASYRRLKEFGQIVRRLRQVKGLSQEQFGFECGLDRTYVSGIERGVRNPTLVTMSRIAEALGTTPGKLLVEAEGKASARK